MATHPDLPPVIGAVADSREGDALGTVTAVFLDDQTAQPTWVGLTDGLHAAADDAAAAVLAPITGAEFADGRLRLQVPADAVRTAPRLGVGDRLGPDDEQLLRRHYAGGDAGTGTGTGTGTGRDAAMTRSEERFAVSTDVQPWARAVLRIEEVTEEVMVPVTVTRQRARIEYLPLRPGDSGPVEPGTPQQSGWVTLYGEEPVVTVERRPVERVRLATAWTTEEHAVSGTLRREELTLEGDDGTRAAAPPTT
ncbi:YsnF/AvaK domain-containing protein [Modestobacter sp. NPDC049651]|uniref:YsnF/AvaK domain-containing protein n=1 Tax=unclassified Modestobacter TaxID=2643866 RepID=UPI0033C71860